MLKKVLVSLLLASAFAVHADEASIRKTMQSMFPKLKVESVTKTPYEGLYEVYIGDQIIYTDENFSFLIAEGRLMDVKSRRDITAARMDELSRIDFDSLPLDQAIKVVKGNGSRKLAVFSDPDCPFCKKLEKQELSSITDVTVYTFLLPLEHLHPDAANKSKAIWCAPDRAKAWYSWVNNAFLPQGKAGCSAPLEKVAALANKMGVSSTPTLFFADGSRMRGAYPAEDIEKALNTAAKKSR
ncbi:MAG: DsbC family protein [Methylophilales bacterium]|nr:DsbC family protein [Methylophilales bacterium]